MVRRYGFSYYASPDTPGRNYERYKVIVMYVSGKKHQPYPMVCRGQVVRLFHHKSGGATDGAQNIILMMRMEEKLTPINIKTWASQTNSGCLDIRVGGKNVHLVTSTPIRYRVFCKWKRKVMN